MAKIHSLSIKNFRGINQFDYVFGFSTFICLIGEGDSGKSTILDAINYVMYPNWNLSFSDSDFHNGNLDLPIEIEATIYDFDEKLISLDKYGTHIRGINKTTLEIEDDIDTQIPALTIQLSVKRDLEPIWTIVNDRQDPIQIKYTDRMKMKVTMISEYIDRHFSWNKGGILYRLLKENNPEAKLKNEDNPVIESLRIAKSKIDENPREDFQTTIESISESIIKLGFKPNDLNTSIDIGEFSNLDNRFFLFDEKNPLRTKGKGTKRLLSIAIQLEYSKEGGIILIDEIEQGLEPHRVMYLAKALKENNGGQVFITTHSRNVITELTINDIFRLEKGVTHNLYNSPDVNFTQGTIRANPDSFFGKAVIVCEGATEVGIIRGINNYLISIEEKPLSMRGITYADGKGGDQFITYSKVFNKLGFHVATFCDSDVAGINSKKASLRLLGIEVFDCEESYCTEVQIFHFLPWETIEKMPILQEQSKKDAISSQIQNLQYKSIDINDLTNLGEEQKVNLRKAIGLAAHKGNWYKNITEGEYLGELIMQNLNTLEQSNPLKKQFTNIMNWINGLN